MKTLTLINTPVGLGFGKRIGAAAIANASDPKHVFVICPASLIAIWNHEVKFPKDAKIISFQKALRYHVDLGEMMGENSAIIIDELTAGGKGKKTREALNYLMRKAGAVIVLDHKCPQPVPFLQRPYQRG